MTYLMVFAIGFIVGGLALMADIKRTEEKKLKQIRRIKKKLEESGEMCHARVYVKDNQLQVDMYNAGSCVTGWNEEVEE